MSWYEDIIGHREAALKGWRRIRLVFAAQAGLKSNPKDCSGALKAMLSSLGNEDLSGKDSNEQADYMTKNWQTITPEEASQIAAGGGIVVAGLAGDWRTGKDGKKKRSAGHVGLIVPGKGITRQGHFYPNIVCGSSSLRCPKGSKIPFGYSDGAKTTGEVWNTSDRIKVKYFIPK
jgi:hypothetical protein